MSPELERALAERKRINAQIDRLDTWLLAWAAAAAVMVVLALAAGVLL
jgi:hypothetical protein